MATAALSYDKKDRWSTANLAVCRANRRSEAVIAKHVRILEQVAQLHGGVLPRYTWLNENGYGQSYCVMMSVPAAFKHIKSHAEKKAEKYGITTAPRGQIMPPAKYKTLAEYTVRGCRFNPIGVDIELGMEERSWMEACRAISHFENCVHWWVGDLLLYGFRQWGKKTTFDLAQQATGYRRKMLYEYTRIAKKFPPERRVEALTFWHHAAVERLEPVVADKLLAEAVELGLTAHELRTQGDDEKDEKKNRFDTVTVVVKMQQYTYRRLKERAGGHNLNWFIGNIIDQYLEGNNGTALATT